MNIKLAMIGLISGLVFSSQVVAFNPQPEPPAHNQQVFNLNPAASKAQPQTYRSANRFSAPGAARGFNPQPEPPASMWNTQR